MADPVSLAINAALLAANMALTASQSFEGPRLDDLSVTTADYGTPLNYFYGVRRFDSCPCFWAEPLTEVKRRHKTKGGKFNEYQYFGTWASAIADHAIERVLQIFFDRNLVYDVTGAGPISPFELDDDQTILDFITIYTGAETQDVDPRMAATVDAEFGAGSTPAYRGVSYILFKDVPLEKLGNRLPQITVLAATAGAIAYPYETFDGKPPGLPRLWGFGYSPDGSRFLAADAGVYELWDVASRSVMVSGSFPVSVPSNIEHVGISESGDLFLPSGSTSVYRFNPDGVALLDTISAVSMGTPGGCSIIKSGVDDDWEEWLVTYPSSFFGDVLLYNLETEIGFLLLPFEQLGIPWTTSQFVRDAHGDLWAIGRHIGSFVTTDTVYFYRLVNYSGRMVGDLHAVSVASIPSGGFVTCQAAHYDDHFVVYYADSYLYKIDDTSFAIVDSRSGIGSDVYNISKQFANLTWQARSIWIDFTEYSLDDLSTIRSENPSNWKVEDADGTIYDRVNHALISGPQFADVVTWRYLDRGTSAGVTLRSIVEDVAERCGLTVADDIDATDLTQTVTGYSWTQGQGKAILEAPLEAYDSEARPHDWVIQFLRRGVAVGGSIPVADMGAGGGVRYEAPTVLDTDLPLKVSLTFADTEADQQPNTALAQRPGVATDSRRELSLDASTLALSPDDARPKADGYLRRSWMKAQTYKTAVTRAYSALEPGDAKTLVLDDVSRTAKLTRLEFGANGVLTTEWERYAPRIHTASALAGASADGLGPQSVVVFGYTKGLVVDTALVQDKDDGIILYEAAGPYGDLGWPGCIFYRSADDVTYDTELGSVTSADRATIGYTVGVLSDALVTVWDRVSSVTVKMYGGGTLTSCTEADAENGANLAALQSGEGWELVNFTTATLVAEDEYAVSGFLRGRRGTEWATDGHAAGDAFVLMSGLPKAEMGADDVGVTIYVKPYTNGGRAGFAQTLAPFTGASAMPYAPAHLKVVNSAGDYVATWVRRTRIGGSWKDYYDAPLGEGSEAYIGQVLDGLGNVIRTFSGLSSPTLTYTVAQQASDGSPIGVTLRVMQVSSSVGNGYPSETLLAA